MFSHLQSLLFMFFCMKFIAVKNWNSASINQRQGRGMEWNKVSTWKQLEQKWHSNLETLRRLRSRCESLYSVSFPSWGDITFTSVHAYTDASGSMLLKWNIKCTSKVIGVDSPLIPLQWKMKKFTILEIFIDNAADAKTLMPRRLQPKGLAA